MNGYEGKENIIKYDFNAPFILSPAVIMQLKKVLNKNSAAFSSFLSSSSDTSFKVSPSGCSEMTYINASKIINDAVYSVSAAVSDTAKSRFFVCADKGMTSIILDCILGNNDPHPFVFEDITDLERKLTEKYLASIAAFVRDILKQYNISLLRYEPVRNSSLTVSQNWAACSYRISTETASGTVTFCISSSFVNKLASSGDTSDIDEKDPSEQRGVSGSGDIISEAVNSSVVTLRGVLAGTDVTLRDILTLHSGDVITLDAPIEQNAEVLVDGVHIFDARPGTRSNNKALKITKVYDNQ